jgi:methyl-accepting chemotaxis protein
MHKTILYASVALVLCIAAVGPLHSAEKVIITDNLTKLRFGRLVEYYVDPYGTMTFNDIKGKKLEWRTSDEDTLNFGFTESAYWLRFVVDNRKAIGSGWYFEMDYPHLDEISLYYQAAGGVYKEKKAGDRLPFYKRDIDDRRFIFDMTLPKGVSEIYVRCRTTGTFSFTPGMLSYSEYATRTSREFPVYWLYFGIIIVMIIYNLFFFISMRDFTYLTFSVYLLFFLLYDATMNGFAFQYLWPGSPWLANNILPFFMMQSIAWVSLFCSFYVESRKKYPRLFWTVTFTVTVPLMLLSLVAFTGNTTINVRVGALASMAGIFIVSVTGWILLFKKSREAAVLMVAFIAVIIGIVMTGLKTSGILPPMFITNWGAQVGMVMLILILSLGLAQKVNAMRKDVMKLNVGLKENERLARERAQYLENAVSGMRETSLDLYSVSSALSEIGRSFEAVAGEQAATSEEMATSFEELASSNERIYESTVTQSEESQRSKDLVSVLTEAQRNVAKVSESVLEGMSVITGSANDTGNNLALLVDKMEHIDRGGKAIDNITAMIDDITDRINLLSLNAAIEAARAGEHGRGFAVVADEISKLASATSDNSREISVQLKNMIGDINDGKNIMEKTKSSVDIIFARIDQINKGIEETKAVLENQGIAIQEVRDQAGLMEQLSKDIAQATREHTASMEEDIKTVSRLSQIAQEIAESSQKIIRFNQAIGEKSSYLEQLIEEIT